MASIRRLPMNANRCAAFVILSMLLGTSPALADAIMRSQAMFADTIAEYFVEDDHVRLELEIGSNDVGAFRNLLPDALYQRLGYGDAPIEQRLPIFASDDMPVLVGANKLIGTVTKIGPATRPLNSILYPQQFVYHGGLKPGLQWVQLDKLGAHMDTMLDLPQNRCPSDTGFTGIHCQDFEERGLTSYDHFGTSYNANLFMTASGVGPQSSNSPYLHRMSDILAPSNTLAYQENNGRFAWSAFPETCTDIAGIHGIPETVHGWHGKDWTFNAAFIDGHADTIYMRGYDNPDIGRYPEGTDFNHLNCIIIRGEGWQIDTLPLPRIETNIFHNGDGRPSHERCISNPVSSGERAGPACSSGNGGDEPGAVRGVAR